LAHRFLASEVLPLRCRADQIRDPVAGEPDPAREDRIAFSGSIDDAGEQRTEASFNGFPSSEPRRLWRARLSERGSDRRGFGQSQIDQFSHRLFEAIGQFQSQGLNSRRVRLENLFGVVFRRDGHCDLAGRLLRCSFCFVGGVGKHQTRDEGKDGDNAAADYVNRQSLGPTRQNSGRLGPKLPRYGRGQAQKRWW